MQWMRVCVCLRVSQSVRACVNDVTRAQIAPRRDASARRHRRKLMAGHQKTQQKTKQIFILYIYKYT